MTAWRCLPQRLECGFARKREKLRGQRETHDNVVRLGKSEYDFAVGGI